MAIIAFDFDGTLTKYNEYPHCGEPRFEIKQCIDYLVEEGHKIIIFTCRSNNEHKQHAAFRYMMDWIAHNNIPYHTINANINPTMHFNPIKPYWNILVDDTALGWNEDWTGADIYNMIHQKLKSSSFKQTELITKNNT